MEAYKLLPYGMSDFIQVRKDNMYYEDKSMFIPLMEHISHFLFFVRPRRFGKSIFLSMLRAYYDINEHNNFDTLFSGLYIHNHPTPECGQYQILYLDFSQVIGNSHTVQQSFEQYGCNQLDLFAQIYSRFYKEGFVEEVKKKNTFASKLTWIIGNGRQSGCNYYLIVDEYDNFTNNILNEEGTEMYRSLTHASGFYRGIFKLFKPNFNRILMMGVSPVTLDDLTSGYNIATNITTRPEFNQALGFSEKEVRHMIEYYRQYGLIKDNTDKIIGDMKPWYDNYCFAEESFDREPSMFNCDMVIYYLNYLIQTGKPPKNHIDPNTKTDYAKLRKLVLLDKTGTYSKSILEKIVEDGYIYNYIKESFPAEHIFDTDNFISLLYYYGMLTILGTRGALLKLGIPNNNIRKQYYQYLMDEYKRISHVDTYDLNMAFYSAAYDGDWRPMIDKITDDYHANTSVRSLIQGERNLQGFMEAFLSLNPYYLTAPEVEMNHGYCDFFMLPDKLRYPDVSHSYILELKYVKANATESEILKQWNDAVVQIQGYARGKTVQQLAKNTLLHLIIVQIKGSERYRAEEIKQ